VRFRSTIVLGLVFVLLCGGYALLSSMEFEAQRQEIAAMRAFDFDVDAIEWVRLLEGGEIRAEAARTGESAWAMRLPRDDIAADNVVWERLAGTLTRLMVARSIGPATDPAKYGLDEPGFTLEFAANGATHALTFGAMEPLQINRYARIDEGEVVLVNNEAVANLNQPGHRLRDRRAFIVGRDGVKKVAFERLWNGRGEPPPGPEPELGEVLGRAAAVRVGEGQDAPWRVIEPEEAPADQQRIRQLLQEVLNANGQSFIDKPESLSDYGLDPAWGNLEITPAGSDTPQTLILGGADLTEDGEGGIYVQRAGSGAVFVIDPYFLNFLPLSPVHFRAPGLLTRPVTGLNRIGYQSAGATFSLVEDPEQGWLMAEPDPSPADQVAVSSLVSNLLVVKAEVFSKDPELLVRLEQPDLTLTLGFEDAADPVILRFARGEEGLAYATQDTGDVAIISAEAFDTLLRSVDDMRSFELLRFNSNEAVRMTFLHAGETYQLQNLGGTWQVTQPPNHSLQNQRDVLAILDAINPVKAEAALPPGEPLSAYGLEPPVFSILLYVLAPGEPEGMRRVGPLYIGDPVDGEVHYRYATAAGRAGVYLIRQEVLERVREAVRGIRPGRDN
jgi:hypothetical protein